MKHVINNLILLGVFSVLGVITSILSFTLMISSEANIEEIDIEMVLEAWRTGQWQTWLGLGDRLPEVPTFLSNCLE